VPRALSASRACVVHSDAAVMAGHPGFEHIYLALAMCGAFYPIGWGSC